MGEILCLNLSHRFLQTRDARQASLILVGMTLSGGGGNQTPKSNTEHTTTTFVRNKRRVKPCHTQSNHRGG